MFTMKKVIFGLLSLTLIFGACKKSKDAPAFTKENVAGAYSLIKVTFKTSAGGGEQDITSSYVDDEIVYRVTKRHHAGLIVRSPQLARVNDLLGSYSQRFADDFVAVAPPPERPE